MQILSRKDLYDLVWSISMIALSKKYNISDNGLRKICKRMNIPLPDNGHWVKLQFGKKVRIKPLPESYVGDMQITLSFRTGDEKRNVDNALARGIKNDTKVSLTIPAKLSFSDPLILTAKERLTGKDHFHSYKGMVACHRGELDIRVAPKNVKRALLFMDNFIKALRARGHGIELRNEFTYAVVKDQSFRISFREITKRVIVESSFSWKTSEFHPTGILCFRIDGYPSREWKDGKQPLETRLPEILAKLEITSDEMTKEQQYYQKQRDEQQKKERLMQEYQERQEKELIDFKTLLKEASRWHKAVNLRNYIDEIEQRAIVNKSISEEQKKWLEWARKKADWYDPFTAVQDKLLANVDMDNLSFKQDRQI